MLNSSQDNKQKNHFHPQIITINVTENLCALFKVHFISHQKMDQYEHVIEKMYCNFCALFILP